MTPPPPMSRRQFLLAGTGLAGMALLAACGGGDDAGPPATVRDPDQPGGTKAKALNLVVASFVHVAGVDQRVTVGLLNDDASGPVRPEGPVALTLDGREVAAELHDDGTPLPYFLIRHRFERPRIAMVRATYRGRTGEAPLQVLDRAKVEIPVPGDPMVAAPSPTPADPLGVDPVCTRQPPCPLHEVSLDAALAEKRPLAVLFSTPARCQSRFCGPVLDTLLGHRDAFGDRVRFLHVEIYAGRTGEATVPTVKAYHLEGEPVLFLAGPDGVVRDRLDNVFDRAEAGGALERLVAS